eukprot:4525644-Alexandrium_andersonii.AAC.1
MDLMAMYPAGASDTSAAFGYGGQEAALMGVMPAFGFEVGAAAGPACAAPVFGFGVAAAPAMWGDWGAGLWGVRSRRSGCGARARRWKRSGCSVRLGRGRECLRASGARCWFTR